MFKKKRRFIIKYYVDLTCYFLDYYLSIAIKAGGGVIVVVENYSSEKLGQLQEK